MKPDYKEPGNSRLGGVYKITNTKNGRVYYGSAATFRTRYAGHRNALQTNKHGNRFLQADYNKTGAEHFVFEVVLVVNGPRARRLAEEQRLIDLFYDSGKNCYNIRNKASDTRAGKKNNNATDPATDKRCRKPTAEAIAKKSASIQRYYAEEYTEEDRKHRGEITRKHYEENSKFNGLILTHMETGEQAEVKGSLRMFCKERGLNYKAFHLLVKGETKSSGGWFVGTEKPAYAERKGEKRKPLSKEHREKIAKGKFEGIVLVNDRGETMTLSRNIKQQARELGLYYTTLLKVIHKETKSVGGWRLASQSSSPISQTSS